MNNSIYESPKSDCGEYVRVEIRPWFRFVLVISALFSLNYLVVDVREWFANAYGVDSFLFLKQWTSRTLYALPKLGLMLVAILSFKWPRNILKIIVLCWVIGALHTVSYYGLSDVAFHSYEQIVLVIHHIIPHCFYLVVVLYLYRSAQLTKL